MTTPPEPEATTREAVIRTMEAAAGQLRDAFQEAVSAGLVTAAAALKPSLKQDAKEAIAYLGACRFEAQDTVLPDGTLGAIVLLVAPEGDQHALFGVTVRMAPLENDPSVMQVLTGTTPVRHVRQAPTPGATPRELAIAAIPAAGKGNA